MAAFGWGKAAPLEEWLFEEGHRFDFFQAVALLEARAEGCRSVGEGAEPAAEVVRLRSSIDLAFPETDVAAIQRPAQGGEPATVTVNLLGLAGALGPLPLPFAELVYQRAARRDFASRDFLDIFNHRLLSLVYRVRKRHRIGVGVTAPEQDDAAQYLYALIGLGMPSLRRRLPGVDDRALLHPAALLARAVRPMAGLEGLLRHHLGVPIEGAPLTGAWHPIEERDRTAIGARGRNHALGRALLGRRAWDQEAAFTLRVGPLSLAEFQRFLPGGDELAPLDTLTRLFVGETMDVAIRLLLRADDAPPTRLGRRDGARLGMTAFLGGARAGQPPIEVRLRRAAPAPHQPDVEEGQ